MYLKVRVRCEWTVNGWSVSRLLLKENTRVRWVSPSWLCSCCSSCDCPSGTRRQNDKNSGVWSSPHSFLTRVDEGVPTCQQVQRGREAAMERASPGLPRQRAAPSAWRARLFGLGPEHLWWLCFLSDPLSFDLQLLGPQFYVNNF